MEEGYGGRLSEGLELGCAAFCELRNSRGDRPLNSIHSMVVHLAHENGEGNSQNLQHVNLISNLHRAFESWSKVRR